MRIVLTCLVLTGFHLSCFAQQKADTLKIGSLKAAIDRALLRNPSQAVYQLQVQQAEYIHKAAKGSYYPSVSGSFNGQDNLHLALTPIPGILINQPGTTFYAQFGKKYTYNSAITVNQDVFDWSVILQNAISKNNTQLSEMQQLSYIQSLKDQVARLYYSILIAKASKELCTRDLSLADSLLSLSRQKMDQGLNDQMSLNESMINYNSVLQNKAQSQQLYDQGIENLKILLGGSGLSELVLSEPLLVDSGPDLRMLTLGHDNSIDVLQQQARIALIQAHSQRANAYPKVYLQGYLGEQQFRNDFGFSFLSSAWSAYRYIGLNITIPIFTGLANLNTYRSSLVQAQIAELQYENVRTQSGVNDQLLLKNYGDYAELSQASAANFKLYRDNVSLNHQKYLEGIVGINVYMKSFEDYLRAENTHLTNLSLFLSTQATVLSRN